MKYIKLLKQKNPLIHCITNTVTVNDCANAALAIGARPIMAEHPKETAKISLTADAVLINLGTVTPSKEEAIRNSVSAIKNSDTDYVLDLVGVAASDVRLELAREITGIKTPKIIKGNASEILAISGGKVSGVGVDTNADTDIDTARAAANKFKTVVAMTGKNDIITDGRDTYIIKNGTPMLSKLTGTGCMIGALAAALLTVAKPINAARYAALIMGICGERAETEKGLGAFHINLMDELSNITDTVISDCARERL